MAPPLPVMETLMYSVGVSAYLTCAFDEGISSLLFTENSLCTYLSFLHGGIFDRELLTGSPYGNITHIHFLTLVSDHYI